jgi:hypothetical protein
LTGLARAQWLYLSVSMTDGRAVERPALAGIAGRAELTKVGGGIRAQRTAQGSEATRERTAVIATEMNFQLSSRMHPQLAVLYPGHRRS